MNTTQRLEAISGRIKRGDNLSIIMTDVQQLADYTRNEERKASNERWEEAMTALLKGWRRLGSERRDEIGFGFEQASDELAKTILTLKAQK